MANYGGGGGGHTGPYWRRQTGTTLPGERTAAQLNAVNSQRWKVGLPPLGGKIGDNTFTGGSFPGTRPVQKRNSLVLSHLAHQRVASTHGRGKTALKIALASTGRRAVYSG